MELKKSPKADLENKKGLFFQIGLAVALLFVIVMFSWSKSEIVYDQSMAPPPVIQDEEIIEITREPEKQPTQPKQAVALTTDIINIVRDDKKIETEMVFDDFMEDAQLTFDPNAGGGGGDYSTDDGEIPFALIENPPVFSGGDFLAWIQGKVEYPADARRAGISGRVTYSFVVEKDGSMTDVQILASPHASFTRVTLAAMESAPKWTPGRQRGNPVRVRYTGYVDFRFQ